MYWGQDNVVPEGEDDSPEGHFEVVDHDPVRDGNWMLFDYDPVAQKAIWMAVDANGDTHFKVDIDHTDILKANQHHYNESKNARFGDHHSLGQRVASVPLNVFFDELNEPCLQEDDKYISKWLNDGDHRAFRTFDAKV